MFCPLFWTIRYPAQTTNPNKKSHRNVASYWREAITALGKARFSLPSYSYCLAAHLPERLWDGGYQGAGLGELEAMPLGGDRLGGAALFLFLFFFPLPVMGGLVAFPPPTCTVLYTTSPAIPTCWHPWPSTIGSMVSGLCRCCTVAGSIS